LDHKFRPVDGGLAANSGIFQKFKNKAWAYQMISYLLIIDQDPDQMENAEAALGAIAGLAKKDLSHLRVVD